MRTATRRTHPPTRARRADASRAHPRTEAIDPAAAPTQRRERASGGPQDRALYVCACGSAFQAAVTASVRCPHCGDVQAW